MPAYPQRASRSCSGSNSLHRGKASPQPGWRPRHQADLTFLVAALDLLQGPSGNPRPSRQLFLGHLAFFSAKPDEFTQQLSGIPGLTEICAVNWRGHKKHQMDIIAIAKQLYGYDSIRLGKDLMKRGKNESLLNTARTDESGKWSDIPAE